MFFMTAVFRIFQMGVLEHARQIFVEPYAETFLPVWSLWLTGTAIPFMEFVGGGLMLVGYRVREAGILLGAVLVLVIFGHLLTEPFSSFDTHVMPRLILLLVVLWLPRDEDKLSLDWRMSPKR
jgi:uncharacterized membrane protein YphA (DoxX/SURF4 family)